MIDGIEKLIVATIAVSTEGILKTGEAIGTASNQVILGALVAVLILVVLYRERQQNRGNRLAEERHEQLVSGMERDRESWNEERRQRIIALMEIVKDNTKAIEHSASADMAIKEAVESNTRVTERLIDRLGKK